MPPVQPVVQQPTLRPAPTYTPDGSRRRLGRHVPIVLYADEWGGVGGTAGYVLMLARGLRRQGYRVAAICDTAEGVAPLRATLQEAGVDVCAVDGTASFLERQRALTSILRAYHAGVLALMMGYFTRGGAVGLAGALAGAGAVIRAELTPPEPPITWRQKLALRLKDGLTDRFVVGADDNREAFAREIGISRSKIKVIHTGIQLDRFRPGKGREQCRSAWGIRPDAVVVGTHARLSDERKGVHHVLDMAARLAAHDPQVTFLVSGDGVLRPRLEALADRLGIRDRVTFVGWQSDAAKVYAAMDIFVMASTYEGGPTTVLEAMAMAKPVVASCVGMVPEVIADGTTGLIVPPGDPEALAEAVARLVGDGDLRVQLSERARAHALAHFSIDLMVDRYLEVFADAFSKRRGVRRLVRAIG